jgi:hypothetical protein
VLNLSSSRKGAVAEAEISAALIRLDLMVLRPLCEGGRYDLAVDVGGGRLLRLQCKWASRHGGVLTTRCSTSRHTPGGYRLTTYSADEIDAIAAYAPDTDECYLIPIREVAGCKAMSLRLTPTRNNQAERVHWARDYGLRRSLRRNWGLDLEEPSAVEDLTSQAVG